MRRSSNPGVVVAAISKEAAVKVAVEKKAASAKMKARAALTVRRKSKEDFKDAIAGHLDALADMIGRNVVLELISTDVDPRCRSHLDSSVTSWELFVSAPELYLCCKQIPSKKTTVKRNNLNPEWNEEFKLVVKDLESRVVELDVFDWEQVGKHDKMGMNVIPLKDLTPDETRSFTLDLLKTMDPNDPQNDKSHGQLVIELTYKHFKEGDSEIDTSDGTDVIEKAPEGTQAGGGLLVVAVHEAQDLEGKHHTNPYVRILFRGEERKTKGSVTDLKALNPLKRIMESPAEQRKSPNISSKSASDLVPVTESQKALTDNTVTSTGLNVMGSISDFEMPSLVENDVNVEKAEACAKELDDICNMLKKKHEEAKELLVRAIVNNNALLMLNHPITSAAFRGLLPVCTPRTTLFELVSEQPTNPVSAGAAEIEVGSKTYGVGLGLPFRIGRGMVH
uniref:C2 domain-containing protein n=1 Tax=Ananas comosus var. bracteatus TaxID=296719 RepID=A0A6V7QTT3_ANACO